MLGLLKNELIKLKLRKKFIVSAAVFLGLAALISFAIAATSKMMQSDQLVKTQETAIQSLKESKEKAKTDKDKAEIDKQISQAEQSLEAFKNMPKENDPNWKENLKTRIESLKSEVDSASEIDGSKETKRKDLIVDQYLLEHNIKPESQMSPTSLNVLMAIIQSLGPLFIVIIIAILASDSVSAEYTPPTMKVLLTRPVSRGRVLLSKYLSSVIACIAVILSVEIIVSIIMGIIFGFGDLSYPVAVGTKYKEGVLNALVGKEMLAVYGSSKVITSGALIIRVFLYQILFVAVAAAFFIFLSTVLKSSALSMSLGIVIPIALNIIGSISYFKVIKPFLFTVYGDVPSLVTGATVKNIGNTLGSPLPSIIILLVWGLVSYGIAHLNFTKKDMLV